MHLRHISIQRSVNPDLLAYRVIHGFLQSHSPNAAIQCNWLENDLKHTELLRRKGPALFISSNFYFYFFSGAMLLKGVKVD